MDLYHFKIFIKEKIEQYPNLKEDITDLYYLCLAEIAEGSSEKHEIELCINDINSLIEETIQKRIN